MQIQLKHTLTLLLTIFLCLGGIVAQTEDLTKDTAFFQLQSELYQRWLDHSGLGQYLKVEDIYVKENDLSLYLSFPFSDRDSIISAWEILKKNFEESSTLTLEQQLFYKASTIMEVQQSMINVQLYHSYDLLGNADLFSRAIYFEDGMVQVHKSDPREKKRVVNMKPKPVNGNKTAAIAQFKIDYSRERVFDCIYDYAEEKFSSASCEKSNPTVKLLQNLGILRFEVRDLCREVLTDEANPFLCALLKNLNKDCEWVKKELLTFTITHQETRDGFRLIMLIDGKFGSGAYETDRRAGYISMEIDFDEYLEVYADEITGEFRTTLQNCE